jgi:hypothetical protein
MLTLSYNTLLHQQALPLYSDILTLVKAGIAFRGDQPHTAKGATEAEVRKWQRKHDRLQPLLESHFDFRITFTQV